MGNIDEIEICCNSNLFKMSWFITFTLDNYSWMPGYILLAVCIASNERVLEDKFATKIFKKINLDDALILVSK